MSKCVDQKVTDPVIANKPFDPEMKFGVLKREDTTQLTLMGDPNDFMPGFGTKDQDFFFGLIDQVANAGSKGRFPDEKGMKFMLAFIKNSEPRDEIEATLAAQMAATHVAIMRFANRLAHAESLQEQDSAERAYNKLARTYAMQMEALQRYRSKSQANVIVQNVSVSDGSQAIVGNVTGLAHAAATEKRAPETPEVSDARQVPMETIGERECAPVAPQRRQRG